MVPPFPSSPLLHAALLRKFNESAQFTNHFGERRQTLIGISLNTYPTLFYQMAEPSSRQFSDHESFFLAASTLPLSALRPHLPHNLGPLRRIQAGKNNVVRFDRLPSNQACFKYKKGWSYCNSSLCETAFHLVDILQTYKKSAISPKPRFNEKKRAINTKAIIDILAIIARTFFGIFQFFSALCQSILQTGSISPFFGP